MTEHMENSFNERISQLINTKAKNSQLFTMEQYKSIIMKIKEATTKTRKKTPEDYQRLARYDILTVGDTDRLICPRKNEDDPIIYYVYLEETFKILHDTHIKIGHGGRSKMMTELKKQFKNITGEIVRIYLNVCETCQGKRRLPKKVETVNPISSKVPVYYSRCQINLINMEAEADGDYKSIMVYQDEKTKFVLLRPLKGEKSSEVAFHLVDIFTIFGAPSILCSDKGKEFANEVLKEVFKVWPELKIVYGKSRLSQDLIEVANQNVKQMVRTWLESNKTTKWSEGLRLLQFMNNTSHHPELNCSPYEAMFGRAVQLGLSTFLSEEELAGVSTEEDFEFLETQDNLIKSQETEFQTQNKEEKEGKQEENESILKENGNLDISKVKIMVHLPRIKKEVELKENSPDQTENQIDNNQNTNFNIKEETYYEVNIKSEVDEHQESIFYKNPSQDYYNQSLNSQIYEHEFEVPLNWNVTDPLNCNPETIEELPTTPNKRRKI